MTQIAPIEIEDLSQLDFADRQGEIALALDARGLMDGAKPPLGALQEAIGRLTASHLWNDLDEGCALSLTFPAGGAADKLIVAKVAEDAGPVDIRLAGAAIAKARDDGQALTLCAPNGKFGADLAFGLVSRDYEFTAHHSKPDRKLQPVKLALMNGDTAKGDLDGLMAIAEGVYFTRDLVNEPANILTTVEFARRLSDLNKLGVEVEILEEEELSRLGLRLLLAVGQGSSAPSKVAVMHWNGGGDEAPLALVGKGVVFDSGGISIKPAQGMEEMTGDMGGAGTVAGVMHALARTKAKVNVVGLVGLVENMPSGTAARPGDVVASMKGDTVEIINTDAEGRLVLADVLWHAQKTYQPRAVIDMATLTGAILVALGNNKAGVFTNDRDWAMKFVDGCEARGEGAWLMPNDSSYDKLLKSRVADLANVGGKRLAGSVVAARFLARFIEDGTPWMHLDIAGTAFGGDGQGISPKGGTGWGVMSLTQLIADGTL